MVEIGFRRPDPCFNLYFNEHLLIEESSNHDHGCHRSHVGKPFTVHPANRVAVGSTDHVDTSRDDITERAAKSLDGLKHLVQGLRHLRARIARVSNHPIYDRRAP